MAQAPRWRYTRKVVPSLEKIISLLALLILLGIAALFLQDMRRTGTASPFAVEAKLISEAARPAEAVAAGYLLPAGTLARRTAGPQVVSLQELTARNADLGAVAQGTKPKRILVASYEVAGMPATAAIVDCEAAERAQSLWTARKSEQAKILTIGGAGQAWRSDSSAAFAAGKYYVEIWTLPSLAGRPMRPGTGEQATSGTQRPAGSDALGMLLAELGKSHVFSKPVAAGETTKGQAAAPAVQEGPLPKLTGPEITGPGEVRRFNPDTLYEKIDGKAQLYLSYSFAELLFTTYAAGDVSLDVYVYDMSQADNAFGIFKAEESEAAEAASVGREGYFSGSSIFFWKGKYYINVLAAAGGEEGGEEGEHGGISGEQARPIALKLAAAIAGQMQDAGQSLWAEQVLPAENRVAGSFEFRKSDAFGLDFLKDVFSAQYKQDGKELTLFVTRAESPQAAQDLLKQYQEFTSKYGKILESAEVAGSRTLVAENTGTYDVVFAKDAYFGGVTAADDRDLAKDAVTRWVERLTSGNGHSRTE